VVTADRIDSGSPSTNAGLSTATSTDIRTTVMNPWARAQ
jgi:hypothetical protein